MKAIQIKFLGPTETKPARLKAMTYGGHVYCEALDSETEIEAQALQLAKLLIQKLEWDNVEVTGFGTLPNGDYVATIGGA